MKSYAIVLTVDKVPRPGRGISMRTRIGKFEIVRLLGQGAMGIETEEQLACLLQCRFEAGQGFLFSPPVAAAEVAPTFLVMNPS